MRNHKMCLAALAAVALCAAPALATVTVDFVPADSVIAGPGLTTSVDIVATFSDSIVGWGLTLNIADESVATLTDVIIGSDWMAAPGEPLGGLTFAPAGVVGTSTLATLEFTGMAEGLTGISMSIDGESQGFALNPPPANSYDADVTLGAGTVQVVPEPATLALLVLGGLAVVRRR